MTRLSTFKSLLTTRATFIGVLSGVAYGLAARFVFDFPRTGGAFGVMTVGFLFIVPVAIGYLTVRPLREPSLPVAIFAPWLACALVILGSLVGGFEGAICIVFASPIMLILSSLGGIFAGSRMSRSSATLPAIIVLPWIVMGTESRSALPTRFVTTTTSIEINAPPAIVWPLVVSVDSIRPDERHPALFSTIGFPQPIAAALSHPGIGGVRTASFERGVVFKEVVMAWEPEKRIKFTIDASTVPVAALDEHVSIGGPFFDVLTGTYELHPLPGARTLLVLTSEHRVSTRFNFYAIFWANRVMSSIQQNILHVLRDRAERARTSRNMRSASDTMSVDSCARLDRESRPVNAVHETYDSAKREGHENRL
jgi:hypothetical protein